jgi:SAM-dependent methyltransferase/uncharacterized protein YbaR (Trm112 family)
MDAASGPGKMPAALHSRTIDIWRCPLCRCQLDERADRLVCVSCAATYPVFGGIPDLRVNLPHWIDIETDRRKASRLLDLVPVLTLPDLVAECFRQRGWSEADVQRRTRQTLDEAGRYERELDDWLVVPTTGALPFLDLGCGAGGLLAAAAARSRPGFGLDVSLEWLVVARQLIRERGSMPVLAAALGEALPLADGSVGGVVSLDVIEHVDDQGKYLSEIDRTLAPGSVCALATPNRYSLSAEPHVSIWGVGWLPRAWQQAYVRRRSGKSYAYCRLLGLLELQRLLRTFTGLAPRILLGIIPPEEIAHFRPSKTIAARIYNWLVTLRAARAVLLLVCPFFRVLARKGDIATRR